MWVKICGNTSLEDALLAAELGADAVGFVFAESERKVTAEEVHAITARLPAGIERVGVFDSHNPDLIVNTAQIAGLTAVQLHGGFDEDLLEHMGDFFAGMQIIQTVHWTLNDPGSGLRVTEQLRRLEAMRIAERVLIDSKVGAASGGTGVPFDWSAARQVFASAPRSLRLILAGGLKPANLAHATDQLGPWGLDVSSGVEASVGKKDPVLVEDFIRAARRITVANRSPP